MTTSLHHRLGLEVPAFGAPSAIRISRIAAARIELNAEGSYGEGGLTPSLDDLKKATVDVDAACPLRVMIRPRGPPPLPRGSSGRDFIYTDEEFDAMEAGIVSFKESGLLDEWRGDGFVFGILEEDDKTGRCWVDETRCTRMVKAARPLKCVFHRAFDEIVSCSDDDDNGEETRPSSWETGLKAVAACGFDGILTSGGLGKAVDNRDMLNNIIRMARDLGVEIIIGGGVRTANVGEIIRQLGLRDVADSVYLHSACLGGDGSEQVDQAEVQGIVAQL